MPIARKSTLSKTARIDAFCVNGSEAFKERALRMAIDLGIQARNGELQDRQREFTRLQADMVKDPNLKERKWSCMTTCGCILRFDLRFAFSQPCSYDS